VNIRRDYITGPNLPWNVHQHKEDQHRITGVTNDDRVAELVEMVAAANIGYPDLPFDVIITPLVNGSPDYIEWI